FLVDAEGDVFAQSLTTSGSVNVGMTTASSLIVENATTLGDAVGDTVTINAGTLTFNNTATINFATSTLAFSGLATTTIPNLRVNAWSIATSTDIVPTFTISTVASPFGRIGIGTTSPYATFSVAGAGVFTGTLNVSELSTFGNASTTRLTVTNDVWLAASGGNVGIASSSPWGLLSVNPNALGTGVPSFVIGSSTATNFIATNGGRVGIGTTNPQGRFSISDSNLSLAWSQIGTTTIANMGTPALAALSPNRVAFIDSTNLDLRVYEFNGSTWTQIGALNDIAVNINGPALAALSPNRVAFVEGTNDTLVTYEFNGSTWTQIGTGLNVGNMNAAFLAALSPNRVAFADNANADLRVYEFNGSTWTQIGTELSIANAGSAALAALSPNRVAFIDYSNDRLRVYEFNGSTWTQIGTELNVPNTDLLALAALSPNRVAFIDSSNDNLRVYEFNGSTWKQIGTGLNVPIGINNTPALAALSPNRVAFIDSDNDDLRVYQFSSPLLYVASATDFPYLAVSDAGYTTAEALFVRTELRVGQSATSTAATSSPALIVSGNAWFLSDATVYGKIGIGTTSPNQLLTLFSSTTPSLGFSATSSGSYKWTLGIDTADQGKFKIASSTAVGTNARLTIDGAGNIGIGTTSPAVRLHVFNTSASPQFRIGYDKDFFADFQVDAGGDLLLDPQATSSPFTNSIRINNDNLFICSNGACPSPDTGAGMIADTGNLIVENKIGIGTSTPNWKLQVAGVNTSNSTKAFLVLSDFSAGANLKHWFFSSQGGNLYVGTSTDSYATSSISALSLFGGTSGVLSIGTSTDKLAGRPTVTATGTVITASQIA
ncbi:MAG: hypothetical protein HYS44_00925, partial [Candidatus Niyogibacteria bacterium]|nr:hypothetical protein [Candidatus Niyogibacteria bacterium]